MYFYCLQTIKSAKKNRQILTPLPVCGPCRARRGRGSKSPPLVRFQWIPWNFATVIQHGERKSGLLQNMIVKVVSLQPEIIQGMEVIFEKEYLRELFYDGETKDKQHRYQPHVVRRYVRVVNILDSV